MVGLRSQRGIALLVTLMFMVVLAVVVHQFTFATRVHLSSAANSRDRLQARLLARSAIEVARDILAKDDQPDVDHLQEQWAQPWRSVQVDGLTGPLEEFSVTITDESSKLNINSLIREDGSADPFVVRQFERLLGFFRLDLDLLDALLDWLDPDDDRRAAGAEQSDYLALPSPYPCRNGPLMSLGELRWVKGWKNALSSTMEEGPSLMELLTVAPTGGQININTASSVVLRTLDDELDEHLADQIIALREEKPFESTESLKLVPGVSERLFNRISNYIKVSGGAFSVVGEGKYRGSTSRIFAWFEKKGQAPLRWRVE
jgi:general secretion pathway protein K